MPFSSLLFLHVFLPAFLAAYWLTPARHKNATAIAGSLTFYAWGAPRFLPVVVALGVVDFAISHAIAAARAARTEGGDRRARRLLAAGVTMHVGVLAYFKYANFFVGQVDDLMGALGLGSVALAHVALPIGVSFITFEEITYLVDVYRGDARPSRRLSRYLLFLTLFPHSIAGPIFRWKDLEAQLGQRRHQLAMVRAGFERFALGLAKKVLVADSVAIIADGVFALPPDQVPAHLAWIGATAYAVQIYFDFSGYSDMAIGLGQMMGFRFKENFDHPYVSASLTEFWTRWHISLSSWMRDYLYIPLGGNRRGFRRALVNLLLVFTVSGLWHGAAWTFVVWGGFHGVCVALERIAGRRRERLPRVVQHALTLVMVLVGWVLFRADSFDQAITLIGAMFGVDGQLAAPPYPGQLMPRFARFALVFGVVASLAPIARRYRPAPTWTVRVPGAARLGYLALFALSAIHLTNMHITPLIYFRF